MSDDHAKNHKLYMFTWDRDLIPN